MQGWKFTSREYMLILWNGEKKSSELPYSGLQVPEWSLQEGWRETFDEGMYNRTRAVVLN